MLSEFCLAILTFGLSVWLIVQKKKKGAGNQNKSKELGAAHPVNLPPEPWGFPLLGHLPRLGRQPHKVLQKWEKIYGPIIGVRFGSFRSVVVNDPKIIREVLHSQVFTGRPFFKPYAESSGGVHKGILLTEGHLWSEQRRFALRYFGNFNCGMKSVESRVQVEITELIDRLKEDVTQEISLTNRFNAAFFNSLWRLMVGERFQQDDPHLLLIINKLATTFQQNDILATVSVFVPKIARLAPKLSDNAKLIREHSAVINFIQEEIHRIQKTYVKGQPRCFMDAFLDQTLDTDDPSSSFHETQGFLLYTLTDFFIAGAETMSTTLVWLFAFLLHCPQVQEKVHQEIMDQIGQNRLPCLADRPSMHYMEAVLNEVLRMSSVNPLLFHKTIEDATLGNYMVAKDTMVIVNLYAVHFNKEVWGDPMEFRPERFLYEGGKFKRNSNLMPFAVGKRSCIAEVLARDQLFLFATSLLQRFAVCPPLDGTLPDLDGVFGVVRAPKGFKIILKEY